MNKLFAQQLQLNPGGGTPVTVEGPLVGIENLADLINRLMSFILPLAGIILFFVIIWGGYDILMSRGEPESLQNGRNKITAGIIGIVLLALSYLIARLLGYIFGVGEGIL